MSGEKSGVGGYSLIQISRARDLREGGVWRFLLLWHSLDLLLLSSSLHTAVIPTDYGDRSGLQRVIVFFGTN